MSDTQWLVFLIVSSIMNSISIFTVAIRVKRLEDERVEK